MNCERFESILNDLDREQILEAGLREQARAHAEDCPGCASSLAEQRALTHWLRTLSRDMQPVEAPGRVESQVIATFRQQTPSAPLPLAARGWRVWAGAVAAVLLVAMGIAAVRRQAGTMPANRPDSNSAVRSHDVAAPAIPPGAADTPVAIDSKEEVPTVEHALTHRNPGGNRPRSGNQASQQTIGQKQGTPGLADFRRNEIATEFLPIGYGNLNLQDGGQIVRVELPRSTLMSFGLPVNQDRIDERVKADVLLGADGLARAIRFVQ